MEKTLTGGPAMFRTHAQIRIIGSTKDVEKAENALKTIKDLENLSEPKARIIIQELIDKFDLKAHILFDGNSVWSINRILANLRRIIEHGVLYNKEKPRFIPIGSMLRMPAIGDTILSDYFYDFLTSCGSIAHYDKRGWVATYPTLDNLKAFFKKNEFGHRVLDDIPHWKTDAKKVVEECERLLFPFQTFMKAQATTQQ
jgi:hypothetical protein